MFKGDFKLEYWAIIEELMRDVNDLKKLTFHTTKLNIEHLRLLGYFVNWVNPKDISLIFKHNEIDDRDMEEFLIDNVLPIVGRKIKKVFELS